MRRLLWAIRTEVAEMVSVKRDYQRKNGKYFTQVRDPLTGRRERIWADTLPELYARKDKIGQVRRDLRYQQIDPKEARRILRPVEGKLVTVAEIWDRYFKTVPAASKGIARSQWKNKIGPELGKLFAWELDETRIVQWYNAWLDGPKAAAPKTINNAFWYIHGAFRRAVRDRLIDQLPYGDWRAPRAKRRRKPGMARSETELASVIRTAFELDAKDWKRGSYADRHTALTVAGLTGGRQSELCGLGWDHCLIDQPAPVMILEFQALRGWGTRNPDRPMDPIKTKREDAIRLTGDAVAALRLHRERLKSIGWYRSDGPVFPGRRGRWRKSARVMKPEAVREIVRSAGIEDFARWTFHSLRHSFTSLEANTTKDIVSSMRLTRHTSITAFMGYMHEMGHALPVPGISLPKGELPPGVIETSGEPIGQLLLDANDRARNIEVEREAERKKKHEEEHAPLEDIARKYVELGWTAERLMKTPPREACATFKRAYQRGYARGGRKKGAAEDARKGAGMAARRAILGAWGKIVRRVVGLANASNGHPASYVEPEKSVTEPEQPSPKNLSQNRSSRRR